VQAALALNKPLGALPALHNDDGSALSRAVMMSITKRLLDQAGIIVLSDKGAQASLKMASWRAGGVRSAIDAHLDPVLIMKLGRWSSDAWRSYLTHSCLDVRGAGSRMWMSSATVDITTLVPVVGAALELEPVASVDEQSTLASSASCERRRLRPIVFSSGSVLRSSGGGKG